MQYHKNIGISKNRCWQHRFYSIFRRYGDGQVKVTKIVSQSPLTSNKNGFNFYLAYRFVWIQLIYKKYIYTG